MAASVRVDLSIVEQAQLNRIHPGSIGEFVQGTFEGKMSERLVRSAEGSRSVAVDMDDFVICGDAARGTPQGAGAKSCILDIVVEQGGRRNAVMANTVQPAFAGSA